MQETLKPKLIILKSAEEGICLPATIRKPINYQMEAVNVDFYLAGHEHHLEYHQLSPKLHHMISGAGSKITPLKSTEKAKFAQSVNGFAAFFIQPKVLVFQFIDEKGNTLFSQQIKK